MHPLGGRGEIFTKCVFLLACWVCCLVVFVLFPSLGSKPSLFFVSLFFLVFLGVLGCVCVCFSGLVSFVILVLRMVWFVFFIVRIRQTYLS